MFGSRRNRPMILAIAVAVTGACETGTEPEELGSFDALAAMANHEAMDETLSSEAMSRFRALSSGVTFSDVAPEVRMAFKMGQELGVPDGQAQARTLAQQIVTAASQSGAHPLNTPIISPFRRGKTFVYDPGDSNRVDRLTVHAWIERGGRLLLNPDSATVYIYDTEGAPLKELYSEEVLADGFFRIVWSNVLDTLDVGDTYFARVEVEYNKVTYSAAVTYTLSLGAEASALEGLHSEILALRDTVTNQVGELTDITTDFRDDAIGRLGSLSNQVDGIDAGITNISNQITSFSNSVIESQAFISNQLVNVMGPSVTNIASMVSNVVDNTSADQARILNRPTTVLYGSTNTILFKTTRGLDADQVTVSVEGEAGSTVNMIEMSTGIGIYSYDLIANWGVGSYIITCSGPLTPRVSDSIGIEVLPAGSGSVAALANTLAGIETQISDMSSVMVDLGPGGLSGILDELGSTLTDMEDSVANEVGALTQTTEELRADAMGRLDSLTSQVDEIAEDASSASKFALSAKTQAASAVKGVRELKEILATGGSFEETGPVLDRIRTAIDAANDSIADVRKEMVSTALQEQMGAVAKQITEMAKQAGLDYTVELQSGGSAAENAADEVLINLLNENMSEVKISLEFMKKMLDEQSNKPVVQVDFLGVE